LFAFELVDFVDYFKEIGTDCITTYEKNDKEQLKRAGSVELDGNNLVQSFEEKLEEPKSNYAVSVFYIYQKETLTYFKEYLVEGNNPDAPGHFVPYILSKKEIDAYIFERNRYDIGTLESYRRVQEIFEGDRKIGYFQGLNLLVQSIPSFL